MSERDIGYWAGSGAALIIASLAQAAGVDVWMVTVLWVPWAIADIVIQAIEP